MKTKLEITSDGVFVPDIADVYTGIMDRFVAALPGLSSTVASPQGQIATVMALLANDINSQIAAALSFIDPETSDGVIQEAVAKLSAGISGRIPATPTVVNATLTGVAGTLVSAGALARSDDGRVFQSIQDIVIVDGGASGFFEAQIAGDNPIGAGQLNKVASSVSGWSGITNTGAGITGRGIESRAELEKRRKDTIGIFGRGYVGAIKSALKSTAGVIDSRVVINNTALNMVLPSITLAPGEAWIIVLGGSDQDVAKSIGLNIDATVMRGNVTADFVDDTVNHTYQITFQRPTEVPLFVKVRAKFVSGDDVAAIKKIISEQIGLQIGGSIFAGDLICKITSSVSQGAKISSVTIGTSLATLSDTVALADNEFGTIIDTNIEIEILT